MTGIVIRRDDPVPIYYSPRAGRMVGAVGNGWSNDIHEGLQFARKEDAREFAVTYLPTLEPFCNYVAAPEAP